MMRCPLCGTAAHTRQVNYLEDGSKEAISQCHNVYCSATFVTSESFYMAVEKRARPSSSVCDAGKEE